MHSEAYFISKLAGASFISCDSFLPALKEQEASALKHISATEMTIKDIRITVRMNDFLAQEFKTFQPDVVFTDSVCFWGKLNALKHNVPMVVSTSTFAFNQLSSQYMKNSPRELADLIFGLPKIAKELKKLEPYGYHVKNALSLVQSDNRTDSIVYTSKRFQPYGDSFSDHYAFVGPSLFPRPRQKEEKTRPLVYISMGTVINDRPDFYRRCIEALATMNVEVILSCGTSMDPASFGTLPANIHVYPTVDQLDVLSKADVFLTHCGMNSVSESLYMAVPMILDPKTNEQHAVARRAMEMNTGIILKDESVNGIRAAVQEVLNHLCYQSAAAACSEDLRSCCGPAGAAEYIENAPHPSNGVDVIEEINKNNRKFLKTYWIIAIACLILAGSLFDRQSIWMIGATSGILSPVFSRLHQKKQYDAIISELQNRQK